MMHFYFVTVAAIGTLLYSKRHKNSGDWWIDDNKTEDSDCQNCSLWYYDVHEQLLLV